MELDWDQRAVISEDEICLLEEASYMVVDDYGDSREKEEILVELAKLFRRVMRKSGVKPAPHDARLLRIASKPAGLSEFTMRYIGSDLISNIRDCSREEDDEEEYYE